MIVQQRQALSVYAMTSGVKRCALGIDFEEYEPDSGVVPVYLLEEEEVKLLAMVEGRKLTKAYRASRMGKNLVVTYNTATGRGWFRMRFELGERGMDWDVFSPSTNLG